MENLPDICPTCLSFDRKLVPTSTICCVLQEVGFEELEDKSICWECHRIITKFYKFRMQAKNAQIALDEGLYQTKSLSKLVCKFKNLYDYEFTYIQPSINTVPILNIKSEYIIKQERLDESNTSVDVPIEYHCNDDRNLQTSVTKESKIKGGPNVNIKLNKKKSSRMTLIETEDLLKQKFKIVILKEEDVIRSKEEKRMQPRYKIVPFKCETCVLGFINMENYDQHNRKHHDKDLGEYICNLCETRFHTKYEVGIHQDIHYKRYSCMFCEYITSNRKAAIIHCKCKHELDNQDRVHCDKCEEVFRTPEELSEHIGTKHFLFCKDCGQRCKSLRTLKSHRDVIHAMKRKFICDVCNLTFLTKSRLECHMTRHGQAVAKKLAYCALCKIQFKNIRVYRGHVKNSAEHTSNRYPCTQCESTFASKANLKSHYNFYHLKKSKYKCEACDKLFISRWRLKAHAQTHHGLSRPRDHSCDQCGKKFYTLKILESHRLTHSELRSFMCSECGDTFKQRAALYTHERRLHRGNAPKGTLRKVNPH